MLGYTLLDKKYEGQEQFITFSCPELLKFSRKNNETKLFQCFWWRLYRLILNPYGKTF